jgi:hypothetical protein
MNYYDILLAKKLEDDRDPKVVGLSVTENGTYSEEGKVFKPVIVNVQPDLITKSITQNGTYQASSDNADGYSIVDVNVEGYKITDVENLPASVASFQNGESTLWDVDMTMTKEHNNNGSWSGDTYTGSHGTVFAFSGNTITVTHSTHEDSVRIMDSGNPELRLGAGNYTLSGWESALDDSYITLKVGNTNYNVDLSNDSYDFTLDSKKNVEMTLYIDANASGTWTFTPKITHKNKGGVSLPLPSLKIAVEPQQDLHGYDAPWVGGSGKNKLQTTATSKTQEGVTYTVNSNGTVTVSGTATGYSSLALGRARVSSSMGNVTISGIADVTNIMWAECNVLDENEQLVVQITGGSQYPSITFDLSNYPNAYYISLAVKRNNNVATSGTIKPQVEVGSTATSYAPYSNICPIIGWNGVNVTVADATTSPTVSNVYTLTFTDGTNPLTVYGGYVDLVSGVLTVTHGYIASYNGETLPSTWISDRDVYAEGTTPTIGAEVCYELATPLTYQLTPTAVSSLLGQNNLWADTGDVLEASYWEEL